MADFHRPGDELDEEALSAYLSGELDEVASAALEERLARDPLLAAHLERIADVVTTLRGLEDVEPPAGFRARLEARLAAETGPPPEHGPVAALQARRRASPGTSPARRPRWHTVGMAAAAVTAVAVAATGLLQGVAGDRVEQATDAPLAGTRGAPQSELSGEAAPAGPEEDAADQPAIEDAPAPATVVVLDEAVELPGEAAVRARYARLPEAVRVLGTRTDRAGQLAATALASLQAADVTPGGVPAAACVRAVRQAAVSPSVVVRVESAVTPLGPALSHVVVTAGTDRLDRVEAFLVDPGTCALLQHVAVADTRE